MIRPYKQTVFLIMLVLFLSIGISSAYFIYEEGKTYKNEMTDYKDLLNFKERILNIKEWALGEYEAAERKQLAERHYTIAQEAMFNTKWYSFYYAIGAVLFFVIVAFAFYKNIHYYRFLALTLVCVSFLSLLLGITLPMLEIGAFNLDLEVPVRGTVPLINYEFDFTKTFQGRMYYLYEVKSVNGLISTLFTSGNYVVGVAIVLFSVFLPAIKLLLSLIMILNRKWRENKKLGKLISKIGKWSMADVFVVACFLAYLSFYNLNTGIETECSTLPGMYFFLTYCMLSIFSSVLIEKAVEEEGQKNEELI